MAAAAAAASSAEGGASFFNGGIPWGISPQSATNRRDASEMDLPLPSAAPDFLSKLYTSQPAGKRNQQQQEQQQAGSAGGAGMSRDLANRLFEASNAGTMSLTSMATFNAYVDAAAAAAAAAADDYDSLLDDYDATPGAGFTPSRAGLGGAGLLETMRRPATTTGVAGGIGGGGRGRGGGYGIGRSSLSAVSSSQRQPLPQQEQQQLLSRSLSAGPLTAPLTAPVQPVQTVASRLNATTYADTDAPLATPAPLCPSKAARRVTTGVHNPFWYRDTGVDLQEGKSNFPGNIGEGTEGAKRLHEVGEKGGDRGLDNLID